MATYSSTPEQNTSLNNVGRPSEARFLFVDGLRGIAALIVVIYHFQEAIQETSTSWTWGWIEILFSYGYLGVDIFFVLSGFVISYSIRNGNFNAKYLVKFGARRSIRLDPAYYCTIFLELALIYLGLYLFSDLDTNIPDIPTILSHFIYAQDLLGFENIVSVFWTLCYEFQFYIFLVGSLVLAQQLNLGQYRLNLVFFLSTFIFFYSVLIFFGPLENPIRGLFIDRWWQFFAGCLLTLHIFGRLPSWHFPAALIAILAASILDLEGGIDNGLITVTTCLAIYIASLKNKMHVLLSNDWAQLMGKLSYSIYLLHAVIGWRFIKFLHHINGADFSPIQAWFVFALGILISIVSAFFMYKIIEFPSHRLSKTISLPAAGKRHF